MDLAGLGALVGDRVRAALLLQLMDGGATRASDLAVAVGASPSLTSAHLRKLLDAGLVDVSAVGRTRHYRLASVEVAEVLEAMQRLTGPPPVTSLRGAGSRRRLRRARMCYDHLAGVRGAALADRVLGTGWVVRRPGSRGLDLTVDGARGLGEWLGVRIEETAAWRASA